MFTQYDTIFEKQHEYLEKIGNELVNFRSETLILLDKNNELKETTNKFSSKLIEQDNNLSKINKSFEEHIKNMITNNIIGGKIEAAKF